MCISRTPQYCYFSLESQARSCSYEDASVTFTPDIYRSNLRNSLSPCYCNIWEPNEFQVAFFFFLTLNHVVLGKSHCQVFVRKILLFKKYIWKNETWLFENLTLFALRLGYLVSFYLRLGVRFVDFYPWIGLPLHNQVGANMCRMFLFCYMWSGDLGSHILWVLAIHQEKSQFRANIKKNVKMML